MIFAGSEEATALVRAIAQRIACERERFNGMPSAVRGRIQHILRVEIAVRMFADLMKHGERMRICGVDCYIVADLPAPGWRVINPLYDDTADLPGGEERTHGTDSAIND